MKLQPAVLLATCFYTFSLHAAEPTVVSAWEVIAGPTLGINLDLKPISVPGMMAGLSYHLGKGWAAVVNVELYRERGDTYATIMPGLNYSFSPDDRMNSFYAEVDVGVSLTNTALLYELRLGKRFQLLDSLVYRPEITYGGGYSGIMGFYSSHDIRVLPMNFSYFF